jgi:predicted MFS family arabinose efflux permease
MMYLALLAITMGFVSAVYWVFAPDFAVNRGGFSSGQSALIWLAVGLGGLIGVYAGDLNDRYGFTVSHGLALTLLSGALFVLVLEPGNVTAALLSALSFGAAYMILTGLYLVASVRTIPQKPSLGPVIPLMCAASGQVLGASVAGWAISSIDYAPTFLIFATIGLVVSLCSFTFPVISGDVRRKNP